MLAWSLCHDGTSPADFAALLAVGAIFIVVILSMGWIARGVGQVDREDER